MSKYETLEDAIKRIHELEHECAMLRNQINIYENKVQPGRKPHNEKWQADYAVFVELYEKGESIPSIIENTPFSRRTIYRYKKYYDTLKAESNL